MKTRSTLRPSVLATLCATLLAGAAHAQTASTVQIYGQLDIGVGSFQNPGGTRDTQVASGLLTGSHIGFRGEEDLGGGMKATFMLESFLQIDQGTSGRTIPGDPFWSRNANVGVRGDFGHLRLGRATTPVFVSVIVFNPLGDSFSFGPGVRAAFGATGKIAGDTGWNNALTYASPRMGGATVTLQHSMKESRAGSNTGGNLMYFNGPFGFTLAASDVKVPFTTGAGERTLLAGASYDFGPAKLYGYYATVKERATGTATANTSDKLAHVSVRAPMGQGAFTAGYAQSRTSGALTNKRQHLEAGYEYFLSKRTTLYGFLLNDKLSAVGSANSYALGIKQGF